MKLRFEIAAQLAIDPRRWPGAIAGGLALCRPMLEVGKACRLQVTAEGVETEEQRRIHTDLGYIRGQGDLYSRPRPEKELPDLLNRRLSEGHQQVG